MAKAPGHQFGQLVGLLVEELVEETLQSFADKYGYFLDKKGSRDEARTGKKVTWLDKYDCEHDLDFVIEKGGSAQRCGRPLAFIETAWRRYTKHSKNKVQEIQGAVLPTSERHWKDKPFLGVVLVGIFTAPAIEQLQKSGFEVLYVKRSVIMGAFARAGISIEFEETTPDSKFRAAVRLLKSLSADQRQKFKADLQDLMRKDFSVFIGKLDAALARKIDKIVVTPLYGTPTEFDAAAGAKRFLTGDLSGTGAGALHRIEVLVCYTNGNRIEGSFQQTAEACAFLDYVSP